MATWIEDLMEKYGRLQLWREQIQAGDMKEGLDWTRQIANQSMEKFVGLKGSPSKDDDVVNLGNITVHPAPVKQSSGFLGKLAIAAGLIATGYGLPHAATIIADALKGREPTQVIVEQPPATTVEVPDSDYELMLGKPE